MIIPFSAAVSGALNMILSKIVISKQRMEYHIYITVTMVMLFLMSLILSPLLISVHPGALAPINVLILAFVGILAAVYNLLFFHGLEQESLNETETIWLFLPLFITVLSLIVYPAERDWSVVIPTIISASALLLSHIKKHHVNFSAGAQLLLGSVFLMSIEALFLRYLLQFYSPFSLYLVRVGIASMLLILYVRPNVGAVKRKSWMYMFIICPLVLVQFLFTYWSYSVNGLVYTMLILNLLPVIVFAWAWTKGKERFEWRKFIAAFVILGCVIAVQILGH